jgi:hypothetical protein
LWQEALCWYRTPVKIGIQPRILISLILATNLTGCKEEGQASDTPDARASALMADAAAPDLQPGDLDPADAEAASLDTGLDPGGEPDTAEADTAPGMEPDGPAPKPDGPALPPFAQPLSNTPGAVFAFVGPAGADKGLRLKSARLGLETISTSTFQEWLAEVVNEGSQILCLTKVDAVYKDASGATLAKPYGYVDGPPYKTGSSVSSSCLGPGEHGALWAFEQVPSSFSLGQVARVEYKIDPLANAGAVPHPSAPVVTPGQVADQFGSGKYWSLSGTLKAVATINNYGVHVYPYGADGMVLGSLTSSNPAAVLEAGSTWRFQTSGAKQPFSTQMIFPGFIDGAPTHPAVLRDGLAQAFGQREQDLRAAWARSRELADLRNRLLQP